MQEILRNLQATFEDSENVWFFVSPDYRIKSFNKKAASNSQFLHNKAICAGDSILDFARDTKNQIDGKFITCFGRAAAGQLVKQKQKIQYDTVVINSTSTYTPVYKDNLVVGVSILVAIDNMQA